MSPLEKEAERADILPFRPQHNRPLGISARQGGCQGTLPRAYLPRLGGGVPDAVESVLRLSPGTRGFE